MRRMIDGGVQCYEMKDKEYRKKGEVNILVDRSGSMEGPRMVFARAMAMVALTKAFKERRRCALTLFSGEDSYVSQMVKAGDRPALYEAIRLLGERCGGGTDLEGALLHSANVLGSLKNADTTLITDGAFRVGEPSKEAIARIKANDSRVFVVKIGSTHQEMEWANGYWTLRSEEGLNAETAATILTAIDNQKETTT